MRFELALINKLFVQTKFLIYYTRDHLIISCKGSTNFFFFFADNKMSPRNADKGVYSIHGVTNSQYSVNTNPDTDPTSYGSNIFVCKLGRLLIML